jgi:hypothetical protein
MMDHHHHAHALHSVPIQTTLAAKNGGGGHEAEKKTATLEAKKEPTPEANPFDPETEQITTPEIENHLSGHDIESRRDRPTIIIALDEGRRFESAEALTRDKDHRVHRRPEDYVAVADIADRSSRATGLDMTLEEESVVDRDAPMESTMMRNAGWSPDDSANSDFVEASQSDDKNSTTMESLDTAASNHHLALEGSDGLNLGQETQDMMMTDDDDEGNDDEEEEDEVATIVPTMMTALTGPTQLSP